VGFIYRWVRDTGGGRERLSGWRDQQLRGRRLRLSLRRQRNVIHQPQLRIPLTSRVVEIDQVMVCHPDGGQSDAPRTAETKLQPAKTVSADQAEFRRPILVVEQVLFLAKGPMDEAAQIIQRPDFVSGRVHWNCVRLGSNTEPSLQSLRQPCRMGQQRVSAVWSRGFADSVSPPFDPYGLADSQNLTNRNFRAATAVRTC
jgi:hypothetical protein